jgi:hypothetical protein
MIIKNELLITTLFNLAKNMRVSLCQLSQRTSEEYIVLPYSDSMYAKLFDFRTFIGVQRCYTYVFVMNDRIT